MANSEVRQAIARARIRHYELAQKIGISAFTLSVWLRTELSPERLERVLNAIKQLSGGGTVDG